MYSNERPNGVKWIVDYHELIKKPLPAWIDHNTLPRRNPHLTDNVVKIDCDFIKKREKMDVSDHIILGMLTTWIVESLEGEWTRIVEPFFTGEFAFEHPKDAMHFKMRWS